MKFPHKPKTSIGTFLLILAFLLGRKIKKIIESSGDFLSGRSKFKEKKAGARSPTRRGENEQPQQKNYAWSNNGELQEREGERERDEEEQRAGTVKGEDSRGWSGKL